MTLKVKLPFAWRLDRKLQRPCDDPKWKVAGPFQGRIETGLIIGEFGATLFP